MEPVVATMMMLVIGGVMFGVHRSNVLSRERSQARTAVPTPTPPLPSPDPGPGPMPRPEPEPAPEPEPGPDYVQIPEDTWRDETCIDFWAPNERGDVALEMGKKYYTTWPSDWQGAEDLSVYMDPPDLADVQARAVWGEDGDLYVEAILIPKRPGWGHLIATEGTAGVKAVKGEVPWRMECIWVEVF